MFLIGEFYYARPSTARRDLSKNRGLFPALTSVFQHYWQIEYIHESIDVFANVPLLYVLCNSLWESNLRNLNQKTNHISFHSIRNPNLAISDSLHDIREDLVHLMNSIDETSKPWRFTGQVRAGYASWAHRARSAACASRRRCG